MKGQSLPESHLKTVVIKFAGKLIVVLGSSFASSSSTLAEHGGQVGSLCVDELLASCFTSVAFKGVWINDSLDVFFVSEDHVIRGCEITLLKGVLGSAVTCEQMVGQSAFVALQSGFSISILLLLEDHLASLGNILVHCRR